jgi:hypothetical protein
VNFLALSPQAAYALLASVALLIVLMYWLKPRPRRVRVASNLIWSTLGSAQRPPLERWHWWLSLLLALATGLSIALALTRPQAPALGGIARRVVLVLDNSPSMAARGEDRISRWEHAMERGRRIIAEAGVAGEVMVLDTLGRTDTPEWVSRETALIKLSRLALGPSGVARMPLVPAGDHIEAHLLTDGVAHLDVPQDIAVDSVFTLADNVAITAFDAKPSLHDPTRYQALVQVFNASARPKQIRFALTGENGFARERDLNLAAGATINQAEDVTDYAEGVLRAEVRAQGDGFGLDDVAYGVVAPHRVKRILLVTTGNRHLESALERLPGVALTVIKPAQYRAALSHAADYDANIFDRFAPPERPAHGALLFRPPPVTWLPAFGRTTTNPVVTRWDSSHPLAVNVSWRGVHVQRAALARLSVSDTQTDVVLASDSSEGVLVAAGGGTASRGIAGARWIAAGFALDDSNFPMQSAFPVFLGSALVWLTGSAATLTSGLGHVEVPYANAKVTGLDGRPVAAVSVPGATIFDAARPGVFTVVSDAGTTRIVANVIDPQVSDINRSRFAGESVALAPTLHFARLRFEPWIVLLALAVALLAIEWMAYTRRGTI